MPSKSSQKPSQPPSEDSSERRPLPFEPAKSRKKAEASPKSSPVAASSEAVRTSDRSQTRLTADIPDVVNRRMLKRMTFFCGLPTFLGVATFFVSYLVITNELLELPHTAVLLVSLGFFGLSVVGLSYGALSASWDEEAPGSLLGIPEFQTNLARLTAAWRAEGKDK